MRFDYYQAGIESHPKGIIDHMVSSFDMSGAEPIKPQNGYEFAYGIRRGEITLATVMWGGNTGGRVLVKGSGPDSPEVASIIRNEWPRHQVVRADVCVDYDEPQAFDALSGMALNVADEYRIKVEHQGDWHRALEGRTLKLGSRQSPMYARIYEKGRQMQGEGMASASPDWVRVEFEVKPKRHAARYNLAVTEPDDFVGCSKWSHHMANMLLESSVRRIEGLGTVRRPSDRDRALSALVKQYGRHLDSVRADVGSWDAVGRMLGAMIAGKVDG